jgi:hypothetical protein
MKIEYCKHMKAGQDLMRIADQLPEQISEEAPERYSDTRGNIESGKQGRCSTPEIVVGVTFQISKAHGKGWADCAPRPGIGSFRPHTERARWPGDQGRRPRMSRTFSTKNGSVESLKLRLRCGLIPKELQTRWTVDLDAPVSPAKSLQLQWVASFGLVLMVFFSNSAISS